jgi:hypothetical protein
VYSVIIMEKGKNNPSRTSIHKCFINFWFRRTDTCPCKGQCKYRKGQCKRRKGQCKSRKGPWIHKKSRKHRISIV